MGKQRVEGGNAAAVRDEKPGGLVCRTQVSTDRGGQRRCGKCTQRRITQPSK